MGCCELLLLFPVALAAHKPAQPPAPPPPPPDVELEIAPPAPDAPRWKMVVRNKGAVPLRLVADARLLSFDIEPDAPADAPAEAKPKPVRCALPADMRPSGDDERVLVLPPGRAYAESFDPRLYCFGAKEADALAKGGKITARLGWTSAGRPERPFVVSPFEGVEPRVAAARAIAAAPFTLGASTSTPATTSTPSTPPAPSLEPRLSVSMPDLLEADRGVEVAVTVTVKNASDRSVLLRLRPDTVAFTVTSPSGAVTRCGRTVALGTPVREMFDAVPAHGAASVSVLLSTICPANTFGEAGLYRVVPSVDTRRASGERMGLATFDGEVQGTKASLLRVHASHKQPPRARPALE